MERIRLYGKPVRKSKNGWKKYEYEDWNFEPSVCGSYRLLEKGAVRLTDEERAALQERAVYTGPEEYFGVVVFDKGEEEKAKDFLYVRTLSKVVMKRPRDWWVRNDGKMFS